MRTLKSLPLFLVIVFILLISGVCGCKSYVGVEWVEDYSAVGKQNLVQAKDNAEGFYNTMLKHPHWAGLL